MPLIKLGEAVTISPVDIQSADTILSDPSIDEKFKRYAAELKVIAPRAKDFLYFTAVMMHAAEAALLSEGGEIRKDAEGNSVTATWEKTVNGGLRWACSDPNIKPYRNSNRDIFPEHELVLAHKKWIGRPLCVDHKSSSVDAVRGVIIDTYYDRKGKRVIAICALDKVNYPDLARKVATGYSTCVSMGTAVGRAVCSEDGCHRVARTEADFCQHMRSKSCYGEINLDLSPMELSIVVNGADPGAKIKQIIAKDLNKAADCLVEYVEKKAEHATEGDLVGLQEDLGRLTERVNKLVQTARRDDENDTNYGTTGSTKDMPETEEGRVSNPPPAPPQPIPVWSADGSIEMLVRKVAKLQEDVTNLMNSREDKMSDKKAYYNGTEEPTPGRPRYPIEDQETVRETEDKHMVGQSPFPGTGPVDGMHPGVQSAGEPEEARKRRLQRLAELNDRALKRQAALEKAKRVIEERKEAYHQGAGGANEPSPGKVKYPNETDYKPVRDKQDKQMVGQKPFPDVGDVDKLHPSPQSAVDRGAPKDEAEYKRMLSRAKLRAQFAKVSDSDGKVDLAKSHWKVLAGDNLILTASVDEITGGNVSQPLYNAIATESFGLGILKDIKTLGFEKAVQGLKKSAQVVAPEVPAAAPALEAPELSEPESAGSPEDHVVNLVSDVRSALDTAQDHVSELGEAVDALVGESGDLEGIEPAAESAFVDGKTADVKELQSMRKFLNAELTTAMNKCVDTLKAHAEELSLSLGVLSDPAKLSRLNAEQREYLDKLALDGVSEALNTFADVKKLKAAYVKYAHGTESVLKRAEVESTLHKAADESYEGQDVPVADANDDDVVKLPVDEVKPPSERYEELKEKGKVPEGLMPDLLKKDPKVPRIDEGMGATKPMPAGAEQYDPLNEILPADDGSAADDTGDVMVDYDPMKKTVELPVGKSASPDLSTKEARAMHRTKLAQRAIEGITYSDMTGKAHPGGGVAISGIDAPHDNLHVVETTEEAKQRHMDVVNATPQVRKQAEKINSFVVAGELDSADVDKLVAHGIDPEAVKYWKAYYGEAKDKESNQFVSELVKEVGKQKSAEDLQKLEVKIKRAYELAYEMKERNMIEASQVKDQVDEIMKWNDEAFESTKRIIAKQALRKQAMPTVGLLQSSDVMLPAASGVESAPVNLTNLFDEHFAGKRL